MPHKAIAPMLADKYGVPAWWSQMVTVGYEQARGLREVVTRRANGFAASASKTLRRRVDALYGAWSDPTLARPVAAAPPPSRCARATDGKSMRIAWTAGGSRVDVNFYPAGAGKSRVQVEHGKLADAQAAARSRRPSGAARSTGSRRCLERPPRLAPC